MRLQWQVRPLSGQIMQKGLPPVAMLIQLRKCVIWGKDNFTLESLLEIKSRRIDIAQPPSLFTECGAIDEDFSQPLFV